MARSSGQKSECSDFEADFLPNKADFRRNTTGISKKYDKELAENPSKDGRLGFLSRAPKLFIISAPSGTGKDTVIRRVLKQRPETALSVSVTTRAKRAGEVDGSSYFFVSRERFREMIELGAFLEYAEYIGEYYGTPTKPIHEHISNGRDCILNIEVQGAKQVMALMPDAVTIFIAPPDMEELERRLRARGTDTEEKLLARLARARLELEERVFYKYTVINDELKRATKEVLSIIERNDH